MEGIKTIIYTTKQNTNTICFEFYFLDGEYYKYEGTSGNFVSKILNSLAHRIPGTQIKTKWEKLIDIVHNKEDFAVFFIMIDEYMKGQNKEFIQQISSCSISYEEKIHLSTELYTVRVFTSFLDFFLELFYHVIEKQQITIKKCPNCGNYFEPLYRSDTVYCEEPSPQDPTKSCKEYARWSYAKNKFNTDEAYKLYKQLYAKKSIRVKRNPENMTYKKDFEEFKTISKRWKQALEKNEVTEQEYIVWLRCTKEEVK